MKIINKLLCKLNIRKYEYNVFITYCHSRKLDGYVDCFERKVKSIEAKDICIYCGKENKNGIMD